MAAPFGGIAAGLMVGKLVFDAVGTVSAIQEISRQSAQQQEALRQQRQDDLLAYRMRSESRAASLSSLLGQSSVAFAAGNIMGGSSVESIQASIGAGAAAAQRADRMTTERADKVSRQRGYGISDAAASAQRNATIGMVGSFFGGAKDIGTLAEWF